MRKRILLITLSVLAFVLVLALGVSASTIYRDESGKELFRYELDENNIISTYEGEFPKTNENGDALTWYVTASATGGGDTVKTVKSFLTLDEGYMTLNDNGVYAYKGGTGATNRNIVSVYFPNDCGIKSLNLSDSGYRSTYKYAENTAEILFVYLPNTLTALPERVVQATRALVCYIPMEAQITKISHVAFHESKCLRQINIPSTVVEIAGKSASDGAAFYMCDSLERVDIGENSLLETIGNYTFHNCKRLKYIKLPDSVKTIGTHAFSFCALEESPFSESSRCESLGGRAFSDNPALKNFIVPATLKEAGILGNNDYGPLSDCPNIEVVTFGNAAPITELLPSFFGRAGIKKVILPNGPTNIPKFYFHAATLGEVCFSNTIETASERVFQHATVDSIRLGTNFKHFVNSSSDHYSFTNAMKGTSVSIYIPVSFYLEAPETEYRVSYAFDFGSCSNIKVFYTGSAEEWADALDTFASSTSDSSTNNWKVVGATVITYAAYAADPGAYESGRYVICDYDACLAFCEPLVEEGTERKGAIVYKSYLESGIKATLCPICSTPADGVSVPALFTTKGISVKNFGDVAGLVQGYTLNRDAIDEYKKFSPDFDFGILAHVNLSGVACAPKPSDDNVVDISFDNSVNDHIEIMVVGIPDEHKDKVIVFCIYVTDGEGFYYLDNGETLKEVVGTSYNQALN